LKNNRIKGLGETVLRVRDLERARHFYTEVVGLEVLREFESIVFLKVADGHGGHAQIVGLFSESLPLPIPGDVRSNARSEGSTLHHFALEIDREDFEAEHERLEKLGVSVTTFEHRWCKWRSLYVHDPDGNVLELVCYDESVQ